MAEQDDTRKLIADLKSATTAARKNKAAKIAAYEKQKAEEADAEQKRNAIELCHQLVTKQKLLTIAHAGQDYYPVYCLPTDAPNLTGKKLYSVTREELGVIGFHIYTYLAKRYSVVVQQMGENEMYDTSLGGRDRIFDEEIVMTPGQYICIKW
jgi:hypothetical protein